MFRTSEITEVVRFERSTLPSQEALDLRHQVLHEPLGMPYQGLEGLDEVGVVIHSEGFVIDSLVSTTRIRFCGSDGLIQRVAVHPDYARKGKHAGLHVGTKAIEDAEAQIRSNKVWCAVVHARVGMELFYEQLGYQSTGVHVPYSHGRDTVIMKRWL